MVTEAIYNELIEKINGYIEENHENCQAIWRMCEMNDFKNNKEKFKSLASRNLALNQKIGRLLQSLKSARVDLNESQEFEKIYKNVLKENFEDMNDEWSDFVDELKSLIIKYEGLLPNDGLDLAFDNVTNWYHEN